MSIELRFKAQPVVTPKAEVLASEIDALLAKAKQDGKDVEGIAMSSEDLTTMRAAGLTGQQAAFSTYKGVKILA